MDARIRSAAYPRQTTRTDLAIDLAVQDLANTNLLGTTAPRLILVLTDGYSDIPSNTLSSSTNANSNGIITFAVGIGSSVNINELLSIAEKPNRLITTTDFDSLLELTFTINSQTCKVPQTPAFGQTVKDVVGVKEKRFFQYPVPSEGLTVILTDTTGRSRGFYSCRFYSCV
jgi:secreted protein with Ig-like and vWFA domain